MAPTLKSAGLAAALPSPVLPLPAEPALELSPPQAARPRTMPRARTNARILFFMFEDSSFFSFGSFHGYFLLY